MTDNSIRTVRRAAPIHWIGGPPSPLQDQGTEAMPVGHGHPAPGSREPQKIVGAPPRPKWSAKAGRAGGADPQESGAPAPPRPPRPPRRAAGSQNDGSTPRVRCPTLGWFVGRGVSVTFNPPWRMEAVAAPDSGLEARWPTPTRGRRHHPIRVRRRHGSRGSRCPRAACGSRPGPACGRRP